tara:strand:+ start:1101 stop:1520 length:420 start_codon:yes stop_codon:yes gene_type:complete
MASEQFQDNQTQFNSMFYESHKQLVERVCMALGKTEKTQEIISLLLGEKTKLKFKKDPNKPKKPKSGFLFFCDKERGKLIEKEKKKNKKVVIGNIAKELGKMWKKLSDNEKKKYDEMKNKDQARYLNEMEAYNNKIYKV